MKDVREKVEARLSEARFVYDKPMVQYCEALLVAIDGIEKSEMFLNERDYIASNGSLKEALEKIASILGAE